VVVIGNERRFPAALIVPDWQQLESYAKYKGLDLRTRAEFCLDPRIIDLFERQMRRARRSWRSSKRSNASLCSRRN